MLEIIHLAHMPPELVLYVALYRNVENAHFLRQQLLAGNTDFEYAFIDASMVVSTKHILAAAFRAMNDYLNERLKSRNIHSEIVFALSPNNNIGEAFRRFGVGESTTNLLVLKVATSPSVTFDEVQNHLSASVKGTQVHFDDDAFLGISDFDRLKKTYKIAAKPGPKTSKGSQRPVNGDVHEHGPRDERKGLEAQILGAIALRGAT